MKNKLETILLIDDDPISNYIAEELLREKGFCQQVVTLTDGKSALLYLQENTWKQQTVLVLLDLNMPVMDGFEFMEELQARQLHQQLVVAVLSSSDNQKDKQLAGQYAFAAYLQKPLSIQDLNLLVQERFA